ncbi:hypothetical protein QMG83_15330 [Salinibacterium sp. G-O1]|uniref:hypothetical protein n=1 Tax=Salinibacterium sp. G-O1 TaxID=3046208 RepID=UPI0024B8B588|nr:hypothetical protein [Salinibacterium sp. G-O1]MDJ0336600.1 hypothetical protein [Salinibacterium sp. G-O1]
MVAVAQLNGPIWTVGGQALEVPAGILPAQYITDLLRVRSVELGQREVTVRPTEQQPFTLTLGADGSVTAKSIADPQILQWLRPARSDNVTPLVPQPTIKGGWTLFGLHHGSGATTWANLLDGTEIGDPKASSGRLLLVARTTLGGIEQAKTLTYRAGAVLMVADAPGTLPADVRRGIRVLSGAAPLVRVPWLAALRGTMTASHTPAVAKAAAKIAASIRGTWKETT